MNLSKLTQTFVLHFGEMGSRWGINRTVGQIYALLYLAPRPLNAEEICDALGFSRSNVSMGLKELDSWQLIRLKHIPDDRREYFTTPDDIWEIVRTVVEQRRKREIEPTMSVLRDILLENPTNHDEEVARDKILEMHNLIEMLTDFYMQFQKMDTEKLTSLLNLAPTASKFYDIKDKLSILPKTEKRKCMRPDVEAQSN